MMSLSSVPSTFTTASAPPLHGNKLPPHGIQRSTASIPKPSATHAPIQELFSSIQGEGPWVGVRQIFVRFAHCHLHCAYCDTPMTTPSGQAVWEPLPGSHQWQAIETDDAQHRLSISDVVATVLALQQQAPIHSVSLTGGEPLLQTPFLQELLPVLKGYGLATYLETSGTQPQLLKHVLPWLDYISMDIKLPSSTQQAAQWQQHRLFFEAAAAERPLQAIWLKCVVNHHTTTVELNELLGVVGTLRPLILLQPETPIHEGQTSLLTAQHLLELEAFVHTLGFPVRVIPQTHKFLQLS